MPTKTAELETSSVDLNELELTPETKFFPTPTPEHPVLGELAEIKSKQEMAINRPPQLTPEAFKELAQAVEENIPDEIKRLAIPTNVRTNASRAFNTAQGIEQDSLDLTLVRITQFELGRLAASGVTKNEEEGNFLAAYKDLSKARRTVAQTWKEKPNVEMLSEMDIMLQRVEGSLAGKVDSSTLETIRMQVNTLVSKGLSDELVHTLEMDPNAPTRDLEWPAREATNEFINNLRQLGSATGTDKERRYSRAEAQMFAMIAEYNTVDSSEGTEVIEVSPQATYLFKRLENLQDFGALKAEALKLDTELRESFGGKFDLNLLERGSRRDDIRLVRGIALSTEKVAATSNANALRVEQDITHIGIETLAYSIAKGFRDHELPKDKVTGDNGKTTEWGLKFNKGIVEEIGRTEKMMHDCVQIVGGLNEFESKTAPSPENAEHTTREKALEVYSLVVGRRAAMKVERNIELYGAAPIFAIPELPRTTRFEANRQEPFRIDESANTEVTARVALADAVRFLDEVSAEYYAKRGPTTEDKAVLSYAVCNAIARVKALELYDEDVLSGFENPGKKNSTELSDLDKRLQKDTGGGKTFTSSSNRK